MTERRRAHGDGSRFEDDQGVWHAYVSLGVAANGRRLRRHVRGKTEAAVVKEVNRLRAEHAKSGAAVASGPMKVGVWLDHWLATNAAGRIKTSTHDTWSYLIRLHVKPHIGGVRLERLTAEHVEALYATLRAGTPDQRPLSASTVHQIHRVLSRALKVAWQRGRVPVNVCQLVDAPKVERAEVVPLTNAEARRVIERARSGRNAPRWTMALALGMRQGEVLGLTWEHVDLKAGTVSVRQALQRQRGVGLVMTTPKSKAGRRDVVLPAELVTQLHEHRKRQLAERMAAPLWDDHDLVFPASNGRPMDPRNDHREWRQLLREAGVRPARLHDARHTCATLLLEMGVDVKVVAEVLGHSSPHLTQTTYQHVTRKLAAEAALAMGAGLLSEKAPKRHRAQDER